MTDRSRRSASGGAASHERLIAAVGAAARPLRSASDLDPLLDRIGDARYVLLGEATHGTSEFYTWRTEITKRLIAEKGFSFVAVEGDWPDCARVDRWVKGRPSVDAAAETRATGILRAFSRWPTWMWANQEVATLIEWMRDWNRRADPDRAIGFHGLDVYSLWDSMAAVVRYLESVDPALARQARRAYTCFDPYHDDPGDYARATALVPTTCEEEALSVLRALRREQRTAFDGHGDDFFDAEQNALVARNAERYYRTMMRGGPASWNVRDGHMVETLERLMTHYGPHAKAVVWEHNTHVGDARFTDMKRAGMVNVGQLVREQHARDGVVLVGFGTHRGSVLAGDEWGAPMRRMTVPPARAGSWEDVLHRTGTGDALLLFDGSDDGGIAGLDAPIDHRAIGVVYDPDRERWGNYVPTIVPRRYDAFVHIEESHALDALHLPAHGSGEPPDTYPSGM